MLLRPQKPGFPKISQGIRMQSNFLQHHKNELWDDAIPENLGDFQRPKVNRPFTHLEAQDELKWVFLSF